MFLSQKKPDRFRPQNIEPRERTLVVEEWFVAVTEIFEDDPDPPSRNTVHVLEFGIAV